MSIFRKIQISIKIFEKLRFWPKTLKTPIYIGEDFRNIAILVKIFEKPDFGEDFRNTLILVKTRENFMFGNNFRKTSILFKTFRIWFKLPKISILVKFFEKSWLKSKVSKYLEFDQNLER